MPGTMPKWAMKQQGWKFFTMPNGQERAWAWLESGFGLMIAFAVRWSWDNLFTALQSFSYESMEWSLIKDMMNTGGLWNKPVPGGTGQTWADLENGGSFFSVRQNITRDGTEAIALCFQDWVATHSNRTCLQATDAQWFRKGLLKYTQQWGDGVFSGLVEPDPPGEMPPLEVQFPPETVGQVQSAMGLAYMHGFRMNASLDPNNSSRIIFDGSPVP